MEFGDIESDMKVGFGFAIEGMEDIGKIDFKKLNASDVMKFHFPNIAVAYTFYNWYARMNGFSARRSKVRRNKNNEIIQQIFVCYRQGFREKKLENNKIRKREARANTRCGCDAKCSVHIDSGSQRWYVWDFNNDHNHSLVDDDFIGFLPGHRGMDDDDILQMKNLRKSGIRTSQAYGTFANHYGGYKNVTFLIQDMYNEVDKDRRSKGSDSRAALAFLRSLKIDDPAMFLRNTVDEEGRLEHLFWSDGRSQLDYSLFGDVLAFDATYKSFVIGGPNKSTNKASIFNFRHGNQERKLPIDEKHRRRMEKKKLQKRERNFLRREMKSMGPVKFFFLIKID
jgi:hypothetical protein